MPANPAETLLSPDNHSLLMTDHQYLQMLTIRSHDANELINHAVAIVEAAAIFKVPMLTTTAFQERQGLVAPLAEASKAVKPIDRTTQFVGRPAYRRLGGENWTEEARDRRAVDRGVRRYACPVRARRGL